MPRIRLALLALLCAALATHAATTSAPARAARLKITKPLSSFDLAEEFFQRYRIWFVPDVPYSNVKLALPEDAAADDAIALLQKALAGSQFPFQIAEVPGSDHKVFQVGPKILPCGYGADPNQLPLSDDVIMQVIPLPKGSSAEGPSTRSMDVEYHASQYCNCVIATGPASQICRFLGVIIKLYTPRGVAMKTESRQLKNLNAFEVARAVNATFAPPATAAAPATAASGPAAPQGRLYAVWDTPNNTVLVTGPVDLIKQALELIDKMEADAATAPATFFIIPGHSNPGSITPVLEQIFGSHATSAPAPATAPASAPSSAPAAASSPRADEVVMQLVPLKYDDLVRELRELGGVPPVEEADIIHGGATAGVPETAAKIERWAWVLREIEKRRAQNAPAPVTTSTPAAGR